MPADRGRFDLSQLEQLATRTEAMILGGYWVYDGEAQLVWTRSNGERWLSFHP